MSTALMNTTDKDKLKKEGQGVLEKARAIKVKTEDDWNGAGDFLKEIKKVQDTIDDKLNPIIKEQRSALKLQTDLKKEMRAVPDEAETIVKGEMSGYAARMREIRQEQERKRLAKAQEKADKEKQERLEQLKKDGATKKEIKEEEKEEAVAEPAETKRATPKNEGVTTRQVWSAEVTDTDALIKFVAKNGVDLENNLVIPNMPALNEAARNRKKEGEIFPGVKAVSREVIGASGR